MPAQLITPGAIPECQTELSIEVAPPLQVSTTEEQQIQTEVQTLLTTEVTQ